MDIEMKRGCDITTEEFNGLLALDVKYFGDGIITDDGMALKRFLKFRDGIIAAYSGGVPAGFACFFGVSLAVYERALSGEYIDDGLCEDDIVPLSIKDPNYILLFDLIVDEPFRGHGYSRLLFGLAREYLRQKQAEGCLISSILGYAITPGGFKVLSSYGGRALWNKNGVTLFETNKELFMGLL